jgi:hypothetical protein
MSDQEKALAAIDADNPLAMFSNNQEIDDVFEKEVGTGANYLPYVIIVGKSADLTGPPHNCTAGDFYLIDNTGPTRLGDKIDVHITDYRMKALKYKKDLRVISSHDIEDPLYLEIKTISDKLSVIKQQKDENGFSYLWGPEYLLWLGDIGQFATFFCSNKTLKRAAREVIHIRRGKIATFEHDWIVTPNYSWWGIKVYDCSTPLATKPKSTDYVQEVVDAFKNEKNVEKIKDAAYSMYAGTEEEEER